MKKTYNPFVYWAQSENQITLKVDLANVKNIHIDLQKKKLQISAYGQGARGCNNYGFRIDFHEFVNPDESNYKVIDRQIDFTLEKKCYGWWPRLTSQPQKPPWLKIDFDKWKSEDIDDNEYEKRDVRSDYPDMYDKLSKEELGYLKEEFKKAYLVVYDLCQFVGFLYTLVVMCVKYSRDGEVSMIYTYATVGNSMKLVQMLQYLEVLHVLFGYTKGSVMMPLLKFVGRTVILFFLIGGEPRMQINSLVWYLFIIWSILETIRYLYYLTQLLNIEFYFLMWLRYSVWIPLFPLCVLFETFIILRSIPYFEETQRYTIPLPNLLNFSLNFPTFLRIYLLFLCIPGIYTMMSHMNYARCKKLGTSNIKKKYT